MGARGQHRAGFYVVTLYALERYYALQAAAGLAVRQWRPAPRQRPDQFLTWTRDSLATLGETADENFERHLAQLHSAGLPHVSEILSNLSEQIRIRDIPSERPANDTAVERHPQARKVASTIAQHFDPLWRQALEQTFPLHQPVSPALLLGGLPPGFSVVAQLLSRLGEADSMELSAPQFYGLAVGHLPTAPQDWQAGLTALADLTPGDLERLAGLSDAQLAHLGRIGEDALALIALRRKLVCDEHRWHAFGSIIATLSQRELRAIAQQVGTRRQQRLHLPKAHRADAQNAAYLLAFWTLSGDDLMVFKHHLTPQAWQESSLDPELQRLVDESQISPKLLAKLRRWTPEERMAARALHANQQLSLQAVVEDHTFLATSVEKRSPTLLDLSELFPNSLAWLEAKILEGKTTVFSELVLSDVEGLCHSAHEIQRSAEAHLLSSM